MDLEILLGRLQLEKGMRAGGLRLLGFLLVFLSLINAYMVVAPNKELFNLQSFFENSLDLAQFETAGGLQEVRQELVRLSRDVKPLMLLSSSNLVDSVVGDMELIAEAQEFPQSQQLQLSPGTRVRVDGPEWTLSVWVGGKGNIIKQVFGKTTCWSWEVDDVVRLRFGAHDAERGETVIEGGIYSSSNGGGGEGVGSNADSAGLEHLAIVVTQAGEARFFKNGIFNTSVPLPRDITSCDGQLVVADSLVKIAALKFHARSLKDREVEDMFKGGRPLVEMATGKSPPLVQSSVPVPMSAMAPDPQLDLVLQQNILQLDDYRRSDLTKFWSGQPLPVLQGTGPDGTLQVQVKEDPMFSLQYYSLVEDPMEIASTVKVNISTLPELPSDQKFTITFWSRMTHDGSVFSWRLTPNIVFFSTYIFNFHHLPQTFPLTTPSHS